MHTIAGTHRGANGLGAGDVDADGDVDYLTNYEFDQRYVLSINPGVGSAAQRRAWPQVQVWPADGRAPAQGTGVNPENSVLGDVDGDGNLDVIGAQGESLLEFWEGNSPGIRVIFGPGGGQALDPAAWADAGRVPATTTFGHFHWVTTRDLSGDGIADVVAGGRQADTTGDYAGIVWLEAPSDPSLRRDLSTWQLHRIDPAQFSGHGFEYDDVDQDGDVDLVDANNDFDTPSAEESVYWYENPGASSPRLRSPWTKHEMYRGDEFHTKPRIGVGDIDGNGLVDYATAVEHEVLVFLKTSVTPVTFDLLRIPKDPAADFLTRPVRIVDVNGDGRLDLVGMLTHDASVLPQSKAAVFWMEYSGDAPTSSNWTTHVIRWGSGKTAVIPEFGEKWDNVDVRDVDGDGDPDIVANCEEWWMQQPLEVHRLANAIAADRLPGVHHRVILDGGTYTVWVRRWVPSTWGYGLGATSSDSAWLSIDDGPSAVLDDHGGPFDQWVWDRLDAPLSLDAGEHDLALRARERGYSVDRIVLTTDPAWVPT